MYRLNFVWKQEELDVTAYFDTEEEAVKVFNILEDIATKNLVCGITVCITYPDGYTHCFFATPVTPEGWEG